MLLFDNYGNYGPGGISRVIEFNPKTLELVWSYTGDDQNGRCRASCAPARSGWRTATR